MEKVEFCENTVRPKLLRLLLLSAAFLSVSKIAYAFYFR